MCESTFTDATYAHTIIAAERYKTRLISPAEANYAAYLSDLKGEIGTNILFAGSGVILNITFLTIRVYYV